MQINKNSAINSRARSFTYAFNGLFRVLVDEPNARLHAIGAVIAVAAGLLKHLSTIQWVGITFAIGLVWITEMVNTSIELLCDYCCGNKFDPTIKVIKDIAAGAVLVAALAALVIFVIIFFL